MSAHDRHLAGFRTYPVHVLCPDCGQSWDDTYTEEYGQGSFEQHEQCPECGGTELDASPLSDQDIAELKAEARGEDF